jgi:hypothetical protein
VTVVKAAQFWNLLRRLNSHDHKTSNAGGTNLSRIARAPDD